MSKEIKALEDLADLLRRDYEKALQNEEERQIAYKSGILYGIDLAIIALESLEEAKENITPENR